MHLQLINVGDEVISQINQALLKLIYAKMDISDYYSKKFVILIMILQKWWINKFS